MSETTLALSSGIGNYERVQRSDAIRRYAVLLSALLAFALRLVPLASVPKVSAAISASGSRLAPAAPTFGIDWLLVGALLAYAGWQLRRSQRRRTIHRQLGWWAAGVALLDAAWPLALVWPGSRTLGLWIAAALLCGLVAVLVRAVRVIQRASDPRHLDLVLIDLTFGAHLGWTSVMAPATIASALVASGFRPRWWIDDLAAAVVLAALAVALSWWCVRLGDRIAVALSAAWGLIWIGVARLTGEPRSVFVAILSLLVAAHIVGFTRWRSRSRPTRPRTASNTSIAAKKPY